MREEEREREEERISIDCTDVMKQRGPGGGRGGEGKRKVCEEGEEETKSQVWGGGGKREETDIEKTISY